jgi:4-hydroxybenzoyl-CoA thioesterase
MTNSVVENFFADVVGFSFARMHNEGAVNGVPTVRIVCDFRAPSRLGDKVPFRLTVTAVGGASLSLRIVGGAEGDVRLEAAITLVWIDAGKAAPWPAQIRAVLERELAKGDAA